MNGPNPNTQDKQIWGCPFCSVDRKASKTNEACNRLSDNTNVQVRSPCCAPTVALSNRTINYNAEHPPLPPHGYAHQTTLLFLSVWNCRRMLQTIKMRQSATQPIPQHKTTCDGQGGREKAFSEFDAYERFPQGQSGVLRRKWVSKS